MLFRVSISVVNSGNVTYLHVHWNLELKKNKNDSEVNAITQAIAADAQAIQVGGWARGLFH